jgi:hypothetical protein
LVLSPRSHFGSLQKHLLSSRFALLFKLAIASNYCNSRFCCHTIANTLSHAKFRFSCYMLTHIRTCVYVSTHMQMQWSITGDWTQSSMPGICKSSEFSTAIWSSKSVATSHTCDIQLMVCNRIHLQSPSVQASKTLVATLQLYFISWSWHRSGFCWPLDIPHPSVFW